MKDTIVIVLKQDKNLVLARIQNQVSNTIMSNWPYSIDGNLGGSIKMTIEQAVMAGFRELMHNAYTDEEFEKDVLGGSNENK